MIKISINDEEVDSVDPILTGRDLCAGGGTAHALGLDEKVDASAIVNNRVLIEKSDCIFRATLNEREFEWPRETISGADIRAFAEIDDGIELILDSERDRVIDEEDTVRLSRKGVERFRTREPREITFWVNGTQKTLRKGRYSFADIVRLAFPNAVFGGNKCYTVGWDQGPHGHETGELFEGKTLRIIEGVIIDVSATDKS
jgi:hypothetical protein